MENDYLHLRRLGIDTHQELVVYMRADCHVCRAEGFTAQSKVHVKVDGRSAVATVNVVNTDFLSHQEAGLSESAWKVLRPQPGEKAYFSHAKPVESMSFVRGKLFGHPFSPDTAQDIIEDIKEGRYSDIELAAYVASCAGNNLSIDETIAITHAMVGSGQRFDWGMPLVMDKHCVGGLPGNRTTPLVVAIATACGLVMPKTSSRAITSPAGTADTMETLAPVDLSFEHMRRVVQQEGGCVVWGGAVSLSPTDDIIIRVERALDLDSEGQLVASVISKKVAAGSTHVLIDVPIGATAKVRNREYADRLRDLLIGTGRALGLNVRVLYTDGSQPIGRGIGPALEARDLLSVFQNDPHCPKDLRDRALHVAGTVLEMGGAAPEGQGYALADNTLKSGKAWAKFQAICEAQGGLRTPPTASFTHTLTAPGPGIIGSINTRGVARLAKLAGAPASPAAGVYLYHRLGDRVHAGDPLVTVHAEAQGELEYALDFYRAHADMIHIADEQL